MPCAVGSSLRKDYPSWVQEYSWLSVEMHAMAKHHNWRSYYWAFVKECGKECWQTWRGEVLASAITIGCVYAINRSGVDVRTALLATAYTLSVFTLWHASRVPWLLYLKLDEADHLKPIWLVVGGIFLGGTLVLLAWTAMYFYTMQPRVDLTKSPDGRDERIVELESQVAALVPFQEPPNSLRRRTVSTANELFLFWSKHPVLP